MSRSTELRAAWTKHDHHPVELTADISLPGQTLRLSAPGRNHFLDAGVGWEPITSTAAITILRTRGDTTQLVSFGLLLRDTVHLLGALPVAPMKVWGAARALGWPDLNSTDPEVDTIAAILARKPNDYTLADDAATALGLGPLDSYVCPSMPYIGGISIVLPARDVHEELPAVIAALVTTARRLHPRTPWEAILVDDASTPPLALPPATPDTIRILRSNAQLHCGGARNHGADHARYQLTAFCDADSLLQPDYLNQHIARHLLLPNLITVSLREPLQPGSPIPDQAPERSADSRRLAHYDPGRLGLIPVTQPITVRPVDETRAFRDFGDGRLLGPVDLPFMVKGNNMVVPTSLARGVQFPPDFVGWGPEDVCFAAKAIARGAFVVPVLSTGVYHFTHPPRSGSAAARDGELINNLRRYRTHLGEPAAGPWFVHEGGV